MSRLPALLLVALLSPALLIGPARAAGYGDLRWGAPLKEVKKKVRGLRARPDDEAVRLEAEVYRRVLRDEKKRAVAAGRKALRAWRKKKKPKRRLSAYGYWAPLGELTARITLHFTDRRLYGADVAVLFAAGQKEAIDGLLALLEEKYGAPVAHRGGGPGGGMRSVRYSTGDGLLEVFENPPGAEKNARGLLLLRYQGTGALGRTARRYLEGLRGRMTDLERQRAEHERQGTDAKRDARKSAILKHL